MTEYHSHGKILILHESILAMFLLAGSNDDDIQRVPIVTNSTATNPFGNDDTNSGIDSRMTYDQVASIRRQFDNMNLLSSFSSKQDTLKSDNASCSYHQPLNKNTGTQTNNWNQENYNKRRNNNPPNGSRNQMVLDTLRTFKMRKKCTACIIHGHLVVDRLNNGSIEISSSYRSTK